MYYFTIIASPTAALENSEAIGGAYVSCWINFKIQDGAELLARHYIREYGWTPGDVETVRWVEREHYEGNDESLQYFLEADADGASFVFHEWPIDAEDADEDPAVT